MLVKLNQQARILHCAEFKLKTRTYYLSITGREEVTGMVTAVGSLKHGFHGFWDKIPKGLRSLLFLVLVAGAILAINFALTQPSAAGTPKETAAQQGQAALESRNVAETAISNRLTPAEVNTLLQRERAAAKNPTIVLDRPIVVVTTDPRFHQISTHNSVRHAVSFAGKPAAIDGSRRIPPKALTAFQQFLDDHGIDAAYRVQATALVEGVREHQPGTVETILVRITWQRTENYGDLVGPVRSATAEVDVRYDIIHRQTTGNPPAPELTVVGFRPTP